MPNRVGFSAAAALAIALTASGAGTAPAGARRLFPMSPAASVAAVAVAADGTPHILYPSPEERLRHAWMEHGRWVDEPVDLREAYCEEGSLAVDPEGRLHIAYAAFAEAPAAGSVLVHGVRDEAGWVLDEVTSIAPGYRNAVVALGPDGEPRILFADDDEGSMVLATRVGGDWTFSGTGLSTGGFTERCCLAIDGAAHALVGNGNQLVYATDAAGTWDTTLLVDSPARSGDLALDPGGRPHVVASQHGFFSDERLTHFWRDEAGWHDDEVVLQEDAGTLRYVGGLVADGEGRLAVAYAEARQVRGNWRVSGRVASRDGFGWRVGRTDDERLGVVASAALGPDGALHVIGGGAFLRHLRVASPDLAISWERLEIASGDGFLQLRGEVVVRNRGASASRPSTLSLFLSDDDILDFEDQASGQTLRFGRIRAGEERRLTIALRVPSGTAGRRLLAVVGRKGGHRDDLDRPNDIAAIVVE